MEKNERIKRMKERRRNLVIFLSLFVVCFSMFLLMTIETNRIAINLFIASDNVAYTNELNQTSAWESAHETYAESMTVRESMYQSDFWYTRWFAYTLGSSVVGKLIRLVILLIMNGVCLLVISSVIKLIGEIVVECYHSFARRLKNIIKRRSKRTKNNTTLSSVPARYAHQSQKIEAMKMSRGY